MLGALIRIRDVAGSRRDSKCLVLGYSMGGMIVNDTLTPSLTTRLLTSGEEGFPMRFDMTVLYNPALDALDSWQFVDYLKRAGARLELRSNTGEITPATGPAILLLASEADLANKLAYPFGRTMGTMFDAFRNDQSDGWPSQRALATNAVGHVDLLTSHRAWVEDGEIILERIPGAYNDTPFWVVRVSEDIIADHGDTSNPLVNELVGRIVRMNRIYDTDVQTWMVRGNRD